MILPPESAWLLFGLLFLRTQVIPTHAGRGLIMAWLAQFYYIPRVANQSFFIVLLSVTLTDYMMPFGVTFRATDSAEARFRGVIIVDPWNIVVGIF